VYVTMFMEISEHFEWIWWHYFDIYVSVNSCIQEKLHNYMKHIPKMPFN